MLNENWFFGHYSSPCFILPSNNNVALAKCGNRFYLAWRTRENWSINLFLTTYRKCLKFIKTRSLSECLSFAFFFAISPTHFASTETRLHITSTNDAEFTAGAWEYTNAFASKLFYHCINTNLVFWILTRFLFFDNFWLINSTIFVAWLEIDKPTHGQVLFVSVLK